MATPAWFDYETYMNNKLAQLQETESDAGWTMDRLMTVFIQNGYNGEDGAYQHFLDYGASEDVSPNQYFDADFYYYSKALEYYHLVKTDENGVYIDATESELAFMTQEVKHLIEAAGMNAWTHYEQYGSGEGVDPNYNFDASAYCQTKADIMNANGSRYMVTDTYGVAWTADNMAQAINAAGYTILEHYLTFKGTDDDEEVSNNYVPSTVEYPFDSSNEGENYQLTTGIDNITGTSGDDSFYSETVNGAATLNSADKIDGAEGTDTFYLMDSQTLRGEIINVENLVVSGTASTSAYDVSSFESATFLTSGPVTATLSEGAQTTRIDARDSDGLTVNLTSAKATITVDGSTADVNNITIGSYAHVTGGSEADTFTVVANTSASGIDTAAISTITGFTTSDTNADTLKIDGIGAATAGGITGNQLSTITSFNDAIVQALSAKTASGDSKVSWFEYEGDTYIVVDNSANSIYTNDDVIIQLVDVTGIASVTVAQNADTITFA